MDEQSADVLLRVFGKSDVGMVRTNNEDAFLIADLATDQAMDAVSVADVRVSDRGVLLAVSDGMGGAAAGEIASAITVSSLQQWLAEDHAGVGTHHLMKSAVEQANRNVHDAAQSTERQGMGATLTAVLIRGPMAHIAEVGDSRAYLVRNGRLRQVTRDQSFVQLLIEQGMLTRDQAEKSPYRNVILQAMGQNPEVTVAIGKLQLCRGDVFVLCSDGLSGKVADDEIRDIVLQGQAFDVVCDRLITLAKQRGGEDNITVVIGEVSGEGIPEQTERRGITQTLDSVQEFDLARAAKGQQQAAVVPATAASPTPAPPPGIEPGHITQILTMPAALPDAPAPVAAAPAAAAPAVEKSSSMWIWLLVVLLLIAAAVGVVYFVLPRLG